MVDSENPCKRCYFYEIALNTNPKGVTCRELEKARKCEFFVDTSELEGKAAKVAALLSKVQLGELHVLHSLSGSLSRDRSVALVAKVSVGDWIVFSSKEGVQRERVGKVYRNFVLVGSEFQPTRVLAHQIEEVDSSDDTLFPEFVELTASQRKRIEQVRRQYKQSEARQNKPYAHRINAAGQIERVHKSVAAVPHLISADEWIKRYVHGIKPEIQQKKRWSPPPYAVRGDDIPNEFIRKHALEMRGDYLDLERPYAGTTDFLLFAKSYADAMDKLKWLLARYYEKWPKEKDKFVVESRSDAFKRTRVEYEGRFPYLYFWFGMCEPIPFDDVIRLGPSTQKTTKTGRTKIVPGKPVYLGRAGSKRTPTVVTSKYMYIKNV
jgi:hypothetical protein